MADATKNTESKSKDGESSPAAVGPTPPKRLPWLWTVLLLLILPAVVVGLWYGGTRHRVEDHPKKVKAPPTRLAPMVHRGMKP